MGERLPEAWMVEWHRNGRVEFPLRRWGVVQFPLASLVAWTAILAGRVPDMLDSGWRRLGYLLIVAYVGILGAIVWQIVTQRPVVVVDRRGIHRGRRQFLAWSDIGSIGLIRGPKFARQLPVHPKNVWAKDLVLTQQHINDLQTFRQWLDDLLNEHRQTAQNTRTDG